MLALLLVGLSTNLHAQLSKHGQPQPPTVLVIHSYLPEYEWVRDVTTGVNGVLGNKARIAYEYIGAKQNSPAGIQMATEHSLHQFHTMKPDLVIISDDAALARVGKRIGTETPIVFTGINGDLRRDFVWVTTRHNITGVMERPLIRRTILEMVRATGLETRKALVLLGSSITAQAFFRTDLEERSSFPVWGQLEAEVRQVRTAEEWHQEVLNSKSAGFDVTLAAGYFAMRDAQGQRVDPRALMRWTGEHSPVPVFTVNTQSIGKEGLVGGMVVSGVRMGAEAASLAEKILFDAVSPRDLPIVFLDKGDLIFSTSQLQRWGLEIAPKYLKIITRVP